jgi:hypothetical protein
VVKVVALPKARKQETLSPHVDLMIASAAGVQKLLTLKNDILIMLELNPDHTECRRLRRKLEDAIKRKNDERRISRSVHSGDHFLSYSYEPRP